MASQPDGQDELPDTAYADWPWREMNQLGDELYALLREKLTVIMREAGEDPDNPHLFALRAVQVAWGLSSQAARDRDRL